MNYDQFVKTFEIILSKQIDDSIKNITDELKNKIKKVIYHNLTSFNTYRGFSGIVISGYGEGEIFPSLYAFLVKGIIPKVVLQKISAHQTITTENNAVLMPFAQSEMVSSFMDGIDPDFRNYLQKQLNIIFDNVKTMMTLSDEQIRNMSTIFNDNLNKFQHNSFVSPILSIVGSLPKSDLAEMAEALVNLTAFKRHVSPDAETVGGPTDVAIISKGDGFIWVKRKHYFDSKLNQHFFDNYFREEL